MLFVKKYSYKKDAYIREIRVYYNFFEVVRLFKGAFGRCPRSFEKNNRRNSAEQPIVDVDVLLKSQQTTNTKNKCTLINITLKDRNFIHSFIEY